jgi:hypothetical protein
MVFIHLKHFLPRIPTRHPKTLLGLDPTTRGCAYAQLDGTGTLLDWGATTVTPPSDDRILARAEEIIDGCRPDAIAVEDHRNTQRRERAQGLIRGIERLAKKREIAIIRVTRSQVSAHFSPATRKQEIAEALVRIFPVELGPRLTKARREWDAEPDRMNIFDAVSFAVTAQSQ